VTALWSNPEFIRNLRSQLRPGKVIATACICAAISVATGFGISHQSRAAAGPYGWGPEVFQVALWLQLLMLAAGGGIACINSIHREKEQNTFDYQRVTRMTPLELTLGKLFGAPVFSYFVCLCLMPLAIFGAVMGRLKFSNLLAVYAVMLVGSLMIHMLALLISLLTVKGSHTASILLLLVLLWVTSPGSAPPRIFQLAPCGPFYAAQIAALENWDTARVETGAGTYEIPGTIDVFFGQRIHHLPVLLAIDLMFAGWFLLAMVRNIKRDPNYYEIYSPLQGLGLAIFVNLLFVGFFNWGNSTPVEAQSILLSLNTLVFFCFGLVMLRNRERVRRIIRSREGAEISWLDSTWPAPLLIAGTLAAGLLVVFGVAEGRNPQVEWNPNFAVLRSLFFVAWIVRDIQFLQWMSLRRGKHALVTGVLFLVIFYVCVSILMGPLGMYSVPDRVPFSAFFVPSAVYLLDHGAWAIRPAIWSAAFLAQWIFIAAFIWLQQRIIAELSSNAQAPASSPAPAYL
jgi:hypothetical protein